LWVDIGGSEKNQFCDVWQLDCQATTSQQVFKVATDQLHRPSRSAEIQDKTLPQLIRIADWYSMHALLKHILKTW